MSGLLQRGRLLGRVSGRFDELPAFVEVQVKIGRLCHLPFFSYDSRFAEPSPTELARKILAIVEIGANQ
jgi:hypothetical protein